MKKSTDKLRTIGIVANTAKPAARALVHRAAGVIAQCGLQVLLDDTTAGFAKLKTFPILPLASLGRQVDLLLVFGGDGTILRVARETIGAQVPLLGINVGSLGFLTDVSSSDLEPALHELISGRFSLERRDMIQAQGRHEGVPFRALALNDVVISRGNVSRLIELEVKVDGQILTNYRCDGLIISTPTGSTAYSLAAGGAVVCPTAHVFAITPICPHTLSNRSVIVSHASRVEVTLISRQSGTFLSADGQGESDLTAGDLITIRRAPRGVRLVQLPGTSFFETLRRKLQWSGSHVIRR